LFVSDSRDDKSGSGFRDHEKLRRLFRGCPDGGRKEKRMNAPSPPDAESRVRLIQIGLLAWLAMIGFDMFLHGGVLAGHYARPHPFLLPPETAFRLIPVGYAAFLLFAVLIVWLAVRLNVSSWREGLRFGLVFGGLVWGAFSLGLVSITTASPLLMLGWFVGQAVELGIAGAVIGSGLGGTRLRRLSLKVIAFVVLAIVLSVALQNIMGIPPRPSV
jgi:hypothetical protein